MAIVKKRREAKVGLKPGYTLNGEIKEQKQDDNEVMEQYHLSILSLEKD